MKVLRTAISLFTANDTVSIYFDPLTGSNPGVPAITFSDNNFSSIYTSMQWEGFVDFSSTPGLGTSSLDNFRSGSIYADIAPVSSVPEPESYALMIFGLGLIGFVVNRKNSRLP